ncbi:MAG: 2-C-methyl-D-erythritol 4-phosphate cytidylyltransferase [Lachnospiraceae bacterium]|nr:2-C-methyl-D-erythritol 4-phosphate cytidylyltransferase [Lachnospiraceae bacterium]
MNIALILAGGSGTRLGGDIPKQYVKVGGKMIISYCLAVFGIHPQIEAIQIVAHREWQEEISRAMPHTVTEKFKGFSEPGENRQLSIYNGLQDIVRYAAGKDVVIVHDAARPLVSEAMLSACIDACTAHDGVLPVLPMKDTVYLGDGRRITSLLDRSAVYAGQAPEAFVLGKYYEANQRLLPDKILEINGSTEPAIMAGMDIAMIPGDESNFKITTKTDLERFAQQICS